MRSSDLIREARMRAGITQAELARRAGTTQSAIARAESGRRQSSLEDVQRLLRLCGFDLSVLLVPYDDSDIVQSQTLASMTPEQRLHHLTNSVNALNNLRQARSS